MARSNPASFQYEREVMSGGAAIGKANPARPQRAAR
jgi:hypothetical protein